MFRPVKKLLFIFCVTFIFSGKVLAVTPVPTQFINIPQPGISCGDALSSNQDVIKCCKIPINSPDLITSQFRNNIPAFVRPAADIIFPYINQKANIINFTQSEIKLQPCMVGSPSTPGDTNNDKCICIFQPTPAPLSALKTICGNINPKTNEKSNCESCVDSGGYWSSLGCFSGNVNEFISKQILGTGVGIAGGISLLCIMFAAFQMQTSSGNAEKIKKAQELLTNCITGLMIIIFSILILKIIGVDILKIPGFS